MTNATRGKALLIGLLIFAAAAGGAVKLGYVHPISRIDSHSLTTTELSAVEQLMSSDTAAAIGLQHGTPKLVDRATQGDDTVTVVRVDTVDQDGPVSLYILVDNGSLVGATYAQNGSASQAATDERGTTRTGTD